MSARSVAGKALSYGVTPLLVLSVVLAPAGSALPRSSVLEPTAGQADAPPVAAALPQVGPQAAQVETHDVAENGAVAVAESFQTAAVTWSSEIDAAVPEIRLRARAVDGSWGPWTHVDRATDGADAATSDVVSSSTVYVGDSDAVEIATVDDDATLPDGVQVTTVSSEPTGSAAAQRSGAAPVAGAAAVSAAETPFPTIITREQWGAAPASCAWGSAATLKGGAVHHTVNANDYTSMAEAMQIIRNDQAFHQSGNDWCDIGYNFLVDKWGNVYEGADGSIERALIGAHTGGFNTGTVGVAMVGTYTNVAPSTAQLDGVAKIIAYRLAQYGVDPAGKATFTAASRTAGGRFEAGQSVVLPKVFGHRDTHQTECPGTLAYGKLSYIQSRASQYFGELGTAVERISGADRFATSAAISAATFAPGVKVAYVANGMAFPDALSGGPAAAASGAPMLLVGPTTVPNPVVDELKRLRPERIVVLGGAGVVSADVVTQLKSLTATGQVSRLSGADRFATSAAISTATFAPGVEVAYVANGLAFADALSGAPAAGARKAPVLLISQNAVPGSVSAELRRLRPGRIVVLGGTGSVSAAVAKQLAEYTPSKSVTRAAGADRFATSAAISAATFDPGVPVVYVANGLNFPDGLSGAPAAGAGGGPVLLTVRDSLPAAVAAELERLDPARIVVLGGPGVVSDPVRAALAGYLSEPAP
ncbi:cell wall-binding repeat-containing protein [Cellulosimicrobium sp. ES-005]|uniref:Cell wall-binding repeat-containing protein n=1 Tax=Cellulosimicrobium sp. ES-005 TaxID=3163031 RepID=A0AAU8G5A1_9MICO